MMLEKPCQIVSEWKPFIWVKEGNGLRGLGSWLTPFMELVTSGVLSFSDACQIISGIIDKPWPFFLGCAYLQGPSTCRWVWNQILWNSKWFIAENVATSWSFLLSLQTEKISVAECKDKSKCGGSFLLDCKRYKTKARWHRLF